jgi:hypothetical protein
VWYYTAARTAGSQLNLKISKKKSTLKTAKLFFLVSSLTMDESALCSDILIAESSSILRVNQYGGIYHDGVAFSVVDKHRICAVYKKLQREHGTVSSRFLAKEAKCGKTTALKIMATIVSWLYTLVKVESITIRTADNKKVEKQVGVHVI